MTDEQKQLLKLEIDTLDSSWLAHLKDEIVTKEFLDLKRFLDREAAAGKKIFPPRGDIYSWYGPNSVLLLQNLIIDSPAGLVTLPSTMSRSLSSAKTPTTTTARPTGWPSPSGLLLPRHHP